MAGVSLVFPFHYQAQVREIKSTADALCRRQLLFQLEASIIGFEHLKSLYEHGEDFQELYESCKKRPKGDNQL